MSPDVINTLIQSRRSVFTKDYTGAPVEDQIVERLLENAHSAPTHKLTEPWRFIVYSGDGRKKLGLLQAAVYKEVTQADGTFKEQRYQNLISKPLESSHIIMVYMKRDAEKSVPEIEEVGAVFCAIQNMYLTATAYGIGCYLSTGGITYLASANAAFGLAPEDRIIGFFHIGSLKEKPQARNRNPVNNKVTWVNK